MIPGGARVVWALTGYGPLPYPTVYSSHMAAIAYAARFFATEFGEFSRVAGAGASDRMYTHSAGNRLVQDFLAIPDATHLFLTELDMVLPPDVIPRLLKLDKPIASGLYFLRNGEGQACLYVKGIVPKTNPYPHTPVSLFPTETPFKLGEKGGCPGLGCVLIQREVFEKVEFPWFDLKERDAAGTVGYGSDMYFYTKVRDAGYEVWVDPLVRCSQMDYVAVAFEDYVKRLETDKEFGKRGYILNAPEALR